MSKQTIFVVTPNYLPGYKAGGPIRTVSNLVNWLGDEFDFRIVAADRDINDLYPYNSIQSGKWQSRGKAEVYYLTPEQYRAGHLQTLLQTTPYDLLYLNGCFPTNSIRALLWHRIGLLPNRPVILAPRGEFAPKALSSKYLKKVIFLYSARLSGLFNNIRWQATSKHEVLDIVRVLGAVVKPEEITLAPNLPVYVSGDPPAQRNKQSGAARFFFLGRIVPNKGLDISLQQLLHVPGEIIYDIFGYVEDVMYWKKCQALIELLPDNITVTYKGVLKFSDVLSTVRHYHALILPTAWENFGHSIVEALSAGCLAVISDQTPWRNLEANQCGWDLPLEQSYRFAEAMTAIVEMDIKTFSMWSQCAYEMMQTQNNFDQLLDVSRNLFNSD